MEYLWWFYHRFIKDLQKTLPTGETPNRRNFSYPRVFPETDNHEKIIEEFRSVYDKIILPKELPKSDKSNILDPVFKVISQRYFHP